MGEIYCSDTVDHMVGALVSCLFLLVFHFLLFVWQEFLPGSLSLSLPFRCLFASFVRVVFVWVIYILVSFRCVVSSGLFVFSFVSCGLCVLHVSSHCSYCPVAHTGAAVVSSIGVFHVDALPIPGRCFFASRGAGARRAAGSCGGG